MTQNKPKSIRIIGLLLSFFSFFPISSISIFLLFGGLGDIGTLPSETNLARIAGQYFELFMIIMLSLVIVFFIGGILVSRYRLLGKTLISLAALSFLFLIWSVLAILLGYSEGINDPQYQAILLIGIVYSVLNILLLWFFNKKSIKMYLS